MRHLAKTSSLSPTGPGPAIVLLAVQNAEPIWQVLPEKERLTLPTSLATGWGDDRLTIATLDDEGNVSELVDATEWLLEIIEAYLSKGLTPEFLQQEANRSEQWRQSLTLQNQELSRRGLELEARREQLQDLQESLDQERERLKDIAAQFNIDLGDLIKQAVDVTDDSDS